MVTSLSRTPTLEGNMARFIVKNICKKKTYVMMKLDYIIYKIKTSL